MDNEKNITRKLYLVSGKQSVYTTVLYHRGDFILFLKYNIEHEIIHKIN